MLPSTTKVPTLLTREDHLFYSSGENSKLRGIGQANSKRTTTIARQLLTRTPPLTASYLECRVSIVLFKKS